MTKKPIQIANSLEDLFKDVSRPKSSFPSNYPQSNFENPPSLSVIKVTALALEKMFILARGVYEILGAPYEIYALCLGKDHVIQDILIPQQEVAFGYVHVEPEYIQNLRPIITSEVLDVLGWTHSHADFDVFFSTTDIRNQITVLSDTSNFAMLENLEIKYVYGVTVNLNRDTFGIATTQYPSGDLVHTQAEIQLIENIPVNWDRESVKKGILDKIQQNIILGNQKSLFEDKERYIFPDLTDGTNLPDLPDLPDLKEKLFETSIKSED
jgi:proteasome lid subunit RPN8/RPN11